MCFLILTANLFTYNNVVAQVAVLVQVLSLRGTFEKQEVLE